MIRQDSTFQISSAQEDYLGTWMQKVSRSFALLVPIVEAPLSNYVATAYLLCRVADNIEDCGQPAPWKQARFVEAAQLLDTPDLAAETLSHWQQMSWPELTGDEEQMMSLEHGAPLWAIYSCIPDSSRNIIRRWVQAMIDGMSQLDMPHREPRFVDRHGVQVLSEVDDYNQYCYIVAGTVGHMLTELVIHHFNVTATVADRLAARSEAFGRALQKTNIVKDFAKDLRRGISYLPDRWMQDAEYAPLSLRGGPLRWTQRVIGDVMDELDEATEYILALPYEVEGYRMATLLCLLPAYQTILLAAQQQPSLFTAEHQVKISHESMAQCFADAQKLLADNEAIVQYNRQIKRSINQVYELRATAVESMVR